MVVIAVLLAALNADAKRGKKRKDRPPAELAEAAEPVISTTGETGDPGGGEERALEPVKGEKVKVAVLDLASLGIGNDIVASLQTYLRHSIATIETVDLISPVDIQIALRKDKTVGECGGGPKCAVMVGKLVRADVVVFGSVGGVGDTFNLNLRALDVATGDEVARQQTSLSGTRHQLIPEMRLAAFGLIAPERITGSLMVEIDVEGVEVEIDGQVVGVTPLAAAIKNLKPGPHLVVLRRPGYSQFQQEFEIEPFGTARIKLDLKKAEAAGSSP